MPNIGYWIRELIRNEKGGCIGAKRICSKCRNDNKHDEYMKYCPNCGTKMIGSQPEWMERMTLDEAIERYKNNAEYERAHGNLEGCLEFRKVVWWLKELKQLIEGDEL